MRRLSRILSLLILTVWFPVTQHCNLEAAGLIAQQCSDDCATGQATSDDGCGVVEAGLYKAGTDLAKVPAPELLACDCFFRLQFSSLVEFAELSLVPVESVEHPLDWVTTWQFVRRAAPSPRAPSVSLA